MIPCVQISTLAIVVKTVHCGSIAILLVFNFNSQDLVQCLMHKYEQLVAFVILLKECFLLENYNSQCLGITSFTSEHSTKQRLPGYFFS